MRNGLAACPMHDAAFDQGYLTVDNSYTVVRSAILGESVARDQGVSPYFADLLSSTLILPAHARRPSTHYLDYHRRSIFRKDTSRVV